MGIAKRRLLAFATAFALVGSLMVVLAPAALAHHPEVRATALCVDGEIFIDVEAWSWTTDVTEAGRYHSSIEIRLAAIDGQLLDSGQFLPASEADFPSSEGYDTLEEVADFPGTGAEFRRVIPGDAAWVGQTLTIWAGPEAESFWWNDHPAGIDDWRFTTVDIPSDCIPPPQATIVIRKITEGGVGTFGFNLTEHGEGTIENDFDLVTSSPGVAVEKAFLGVPTESWYSASEDAPLPAGWVLTSSECDSSLEGSPDPSEFTVTAGETVTCTFVNTFTAPPPPPPLPTEVRIEVAGVCETNPTTLEGLGALYVTVTPAGGATVVLPGAEKVRDGVYTIAEGSVWTWSATANPGYVLVGDKSGGGTIGLCSAQVLGTTIAPSTTLAVSPATLPFTGTSSGSALAIGMALASLGGLVVVASRREVEEETRADL